MKIKFYLNSLVLGALAAVLLTGCKDDKELPFYVSLLTNSSYIIQENALAGDDDPPLFTPVLVVKSTMALSNISITGVQHGNEYPGFPIDNFYETFDNSAVAGVVRGELNTSYKVAADASSGEHFEKIWPIEVHSTQVMDKMEVESFEYNRSTGVFTVTLAAAVEKAKEYLFAFTREDPRDGSFYRANRDWIKVSTDNMTAMGDNRLKITCDPGIKGNTGVSTWEVRFVAANNVTADFTFRLIQESATGYYDSTTNEFSW